MQSKIVPKDQCDFVAMNAGLLCNRVYMYAKALYIARVFNKRSCITQASLVVSFRVI